MVCHSSVVIVLGRPNGEEGQREISLGSDDVIIDIVLMDVIYGAIYVMTFLAGSCPHTTGPAHHHHQGRIDQREFIPLEVLNNFHIHSSSIHFPVGWIVKVNVRKGLMPS